MICSFFCRAVYLLLFWSIDYGRFTVDTSTNNALKVPNEAFFNLKKGQPLHKGQNIILFLICPLLEVTTDSVCIVCNIPICVLIIIAALTYVYNLFQYFTEYRHKFWTHHTEQMPPILPHRRHCHPLFSIYLLQPPQPMWYIVDCWENRESAMNQWQTAQGKYTK